MIRHPSTISSGEPRAVRLDRRSGMFVQPPDSGQGGPGATSEPPVVARLIVEIRSDGTTTIARGGLTDVVSGNSAAIEARGTTPLALALDLGRSLFGLSHFGARAARALLPGSARKR